MSVSNLDEARERRKKLDSEKNAAFTTSGGTPPSGGGPNDPNMGSRVAVLEHIAKDSIEAFKDIRVDLKAIRSDLAEMKGKVSSMPTTWVMLTAIIGSMVGLLGFAFVVVRYAAIPH